MATLRNRITYKRQIITQALMKRITIILLLSLFSLAACTVDELPPLSNEPIRDFDGVIIANYPYVWAHSHVTDTTAKQYTRFEFKTYDCTFPMFDNGRKVIVGNIYGGISCLNTDNGSEVWNCKLLDNPDVFFTPPILDYFVSSTEQWLIINMDGVFVKIDLKNGAILGKCVIESNKASRMHRDSDEYFYLSGKTDVYRVDCQNMTASKVDIFDDNKIHEYVSVVPYTRNGKQYMFVQEMISHTPPKDEWSRCYVSSFLLSPNEQKMTFDTLYAFPETYAHIWNLSIHSFFVLDELDRETYLFMGNGFEIFNWDSMKVVLSVKTGADDIGNLDMEQYYRYHEIFGDKLVCYFDNNKGYYNDKYVFNYRINVNLFDRYSGTYFISKKLEKKSSSKSCGSTIFDGIDYLVRKEFLIAKEFESDNLLMQVYVGNKDMGEIVGFSLNNDLDKTEAHEHAIGKNTAGKTIIVFATDDKVFCYPGL